VGSADFSVGKKVFRRDDRAPAQGETPREVEGFDFRTVFPVRPVRAPPSVSSFLLAPRPEAGHRSDEQVPSFAIAFQREPAPYALCTRESRRALKAAFSALSFRPGS